MKKIISILLAMLMIMPFAVPFASAADAIGTIAITIETADLGGKSVDSYADYVTIGTEGVIFEESNGPAVEAFNKTTENYDSEFEGGNYYTFTVKLTEAPYYALPAAGSFAEVEVNGSKYAALVQEKSTVSGTISFISFEIELNKDQKFKKERTKRTPQINFDIDNQLFEIVGVSFPEDANEYYAQIESWVEDHEDVISQLQNPVLKIDLEYLNSISLKNIARTIRRLLDTNEEKFTVNWYYDTDDEILREEGSEISEILHKKFNFIPKN